MERCHGTTKSGDRCKRSAREGALFCSIHVDQAEEAAQAAGAGVDESRERDLLDVVIGVGVASLALAGILLFRRVFRFP